MLYGRAITSIARLTAADIELDDDETLLRFDEVTVPLPPPLAALVHTLADTATSTGTFQHAADPARSLFPGRAPAQPTATNVLARKLRQHGIDPLPSRHSARAAWSRDLPVPIAADLLGINITTATRWAGRTRRDWTDYLAARADHQPSQQP